MNITPDVAERFWPEVKVRGENDCWYWQASQNGHGYGQFCVQGQARGAHRVAYTIAFGPIPDGLHVIHSCDNRACCNPAHLRTGTNQDNVNDMVARGRNRSVCGEDNYAAKLRVADVIAIRKAIAEGVSHRKLSKQFNVTKSTVWAIAHRKKWKHINER